ncbi:MAG TPA: metallophosphoesterase [Solirubrobacteraceae bacterium]|nr:metallophosphoesterase [Solirubrobacteraceae bacterium]
MRTLIVSDLHLGSGSGADVLRRPEPRAALLETLEDIDRLVLLGDVLELRHGPPRHAMTAARPFFEDLGRVLAGREIVVSAGNHDHQLVTSWLDERALREPEPLGLEQRLLPAQASPMLARIAEWASPARVLVAYPGLWVRPDVYATHGHYLDCHLTVPTLERLSVAAMSRVLGRPAAAFSRVEDYEAVGAPVFAWRDAVARGARGGGALKRVDTVRAWRALGGEGSGSSPARKLRRLALAGAFPLAVAGLNRAGLGPLRTDISTEELRRAGLRAMGEVADRLGLGDTHVIFGHTHRAGPLPGDLASEWLGRGGARLVNAGCWTYDLAFLGRASGETPYWPGTCVLVEDSGPPVLKRLLLDRSRAELAPSRVAEATPSPA